MPERLRTYAPIDRRRRRLAGLVVLLPVLVLLGSGITLMLAAGAHQTNCLDSYWWCEDRRFAWQVIGATLNALAMLWLAAFFSTVSWQVIRQKRFPGLTTSQQKRLMRAPYRPPGADGAGYVRLLEGWQAVLFALCAMLLPACLLLYFAGLRLSAVAAAL